MIVTDANFSVNKISFRHINEYQFATALSDFVSDEAVGKSVKLLKAYGLKVF